MYYACLLDLKKIKLSPFMKIAITYAFLALIAMATNIGTQDLTTRIYGGAFHIPVSMIAGTAVGLFVKYVLDKRFIFSFRANSVAHDGYIFVLYTVMGILTTAMFWIVELGFDHLFSTREMRYVGAALGLTLGYVTKYRLDKRYVFVNKSVAGA